MDDIRFESAGTDGPGTTGLAWAIAPVLERWRLVAITSLAIAVGTAIVAAMLPDRYEAKVVLAAVSNTKLPGGLDVGLASTLLGGALTGGLQPTPALVVQLTDLHGVLYPVAMSRVDSASAERVIERVARKHVAEANPEWVDRKMRYLLNASYDRQTGLITVRVTHRDSALARLLVDRIVNATSRAFVTAARAQASQLHRSQIQRVDSAGRHLRSLEQQMLNFNRENRTVAAYSPAFLEHQQLARDLDIAQSVYARAVADREAAVAKELEETPTVVAVDPLPAELPALRKRLALATCVALLGAFSLMSLIVIVADRMRTTERESPDRERIRSALREIPLLRRLVA
jgi:uncharacterized protein involved in exopolysaccharide biosynthesis